MQLNICPTSNVILGRVESIKKNPIRKLFDAGIKVTINSDNVLIFDSPVFWRIYENVQSWCI
ncbi:hypothetical protein [Vallitalea sp.]|uniref:hypothetical protein n=1 Tax=Vallitalea sp. TaxID=1882829 RepID=UPI003FCDD78D